MLNNLLHKFDLKRSLKSGVYVDFFYKKLSLHLLRNQFNWASIFILEKYLLEYSSRYLFSLLTPISTKTSKGSSFNYFFIAYFLVVAALL